MSIGNDGLLVIGKGEESQNSGSPNLEKMKTTDAFTRGKTLIGTILGHMNDITKCQHNFISNIFLLYISGLIFCKWEGRENIKSNGRERPKLFSGKVDTSNVDKQIFKKEYNNDEIIIYWAVVYSVSLKRTIKVAYVEFLTQTQYMYSSNQDVFQHRP